MFPKKTIKISIIALLFFSSSLFLYFFVEAKTIIKTASKIVITTPPSIQEGLVGWWTFDGKNVVSGVALDSSGNGNNGNLINIASSTFYAAGKIGQGFRFDGTDDYVDAGAFTDNMETLTVSAWIYRTGNCYGIAGSFWRHIVSKGGDFQSAFRFATDTCQIQFYWIYSGTSVDSRSSASDTIPLNVWKHVAATYDVNGDRKARLYIDGEEVSYASQTASTGTRQDNSAVNLYIGNATTGGTRFFPGKIDDVRIYNRALSANEIMQLYNSGKVIIKTGI